MKPSNTRSDPRKEFAGRACLNATSTPPPAVNGCDTVPRGPCAESVENIRSLLELLRGSISRAEQKLSPALSEVPGLEDGGPMPVAHSVLHGTLLDFEDQLRRVIVSVELLANRSTL